MTPRETGIFAIGFSAGLLSLTLGLWAAGGLSRRVAPTAAHAMQGPEVPAPSLTDFSAPPPPHTPVASLPSPGSVANGDADRTAPEPSLRLAMPIAGIPPDRVTDTFSDTRGGHKHEALDIPAVRGTPVTAVAEGNVAKLFTSKQGGLTVYQFDDSGRWCYYYAHLDHYQPSLKEGMLLRKGDILGYVGTTGDAPPNAPHLHFAIFRLGAEKQWWKGTAVDPLPLLKAR
jgi:murein DD-endopeptidase MepM/ murein hydrolase activator NlpD